MKKVTFSKMVASGNDFVVIDNRNRAVKDARRFAQSVCRPHTGIGADGVLLLEPSQKADFKMRIINADGSEAEACGNGFRCAALFAKEKLSSPSRLRFESLSGIIGAELRGNQIKVELVRPKGFLENKTLRIAGRPLRYSFLNTGVPHVVIFVEGLPKIDVEQLGCAIREHGNFKPRGTNVNFVEIESKNEIHVRTYERGVEGETLACGTGSTACAIVSTLAGYTKPPVRVRTRGGETLIINFEYKGKKVERVTLEGEARFVYEGNLSNGVL